jgi:hypothetical protein
MMKYFCEASAVQYLKENSFNYTYCETNLKSFQLNLNKSKHINVEVITIYTQVALEFNFIENKNNGQMHPPFGVALRKCILFTNNCLIYGIKETTGRWQDDSKRLHSVSMAISFIL